MPHQCRSTEKGNCAGDPTRSLQTLEGQAGGGVAKDATRPLDCGAKEHEGATGSQANQGCQDSGEKGEGEGKIEVSVMGLLQQGKTPSHLSEILGSKPQSVSLMVAEQGKCSHSYGIST